MATIFSFFLLILSCTIFFFFFFNDTATTEIYTLSLHDALPICRFAGRGTAATDHSEADPSDRRRRDAGGARSEEHTSELQSLTNLVCRLLLEKKNKARESTAPQGADGTETVPRADVDSTQRSHT